MKKAQVLLHVDHVFVCPLHTSWNASLENQLHYIAARLASLILLLHEDGKAELAKMTFVWTIW